MAEALTESFCERCGTRYEFTAPTRLNPLRKTRGLVTGLKNYIMSQDALADSVGDAMRSEEEELAAGHLEAFHAAFNFCIDCRQYTCTNCWNDSAGRCRSCAPVAGTDDLLERFEASFAAGHQAVAEAPTAELGGSDPGRRLGIETWPTSDLPVGAEDGHLPPEPVWPDAAPSEPEAEPRPWTAPAPEPEQVVAEAPAAPPEDAPSPSQPWTDPAFEPAPLSASEPTPEPSWPMREATPEPIAAGAGAPEAAPPHLTVLGWDDDHAFDLLPEPVVATDAQPIAPEPEPERIAAARPVEPRTPIEAEQPAIAQPLEPWTMPEPVVAQPAPIAAMPEVGEPEPVAARADDREPEPMPEAVAATAPPEPEAEPLPATPRTLRPIGDTILHLPQSEQRVPPAPATMPPLAAEDPMAAARRAQLDLLGLEDPGQGSVQATRQNVIPYRSSGAAASPTHSRAQAPNAFWDASAREVAGAMSAIGVQSCGQCGLSLSASARFCRRCGTRQAQPA
jgi:hypothetical protein